MTIYRKFIAILSLAFSAFAAGPAAAQMPTQYIDAPPPRGTFQLQSMFLESQNLCLEGNKIGPGATLNGASFMAPCGNFSGQVWKAVPTGNGFYTKLTTLFGEPDGLCLEGSETLTPGDPLRGAARMDPCGNFTGQTFKFVDLGTGYFYITYMANENRCLESSRFGAPNDPLGGASRMDPCDNRSGQFWKVIPF